MRNLLITVDFFRIVSEALNLAEEHQIVREER